MCSLPVGGIYPVACVLYIGFSCWLGSGFDSPRCCQKFSGRRNFSSVSKTKAQITIEIFVEI